MNLSALPVLLAVAAIAFAAPDKLGKGKTKPALKTTTPAADLSLEFDCSDKEDRGYVIGCSQDYYLCWHGVATKAFCPDGMMFNQDNGQCDFNTNIFECSGVRTTTVLADEPSTLAPINFDCSKLTDGDYAFSSSCQMTYVSCFGGQGIERTCPDQLQFDPENRICDRIEHIEACGGSATTVAPTMEIEFNCPSPSGSFAITSQLCSAIYYSCNDNVASIAVCDGEMIWDDKKKTCALAKNIPDCSFDCTGKADAAYSEGCSQSYWWCWQERAIKQLCPEGMKFDGELGLCDFENNVFECTGVRTTTPLADVPSTMKPVNFDCTGLEDGNHAYTHGEKCQDMFVSCVGGFAWEMTCPDGLLFDPDQLLCERLDAIVACGGTAAPISTTLADYGYQTTTPLPTTRRIQKTTTAADVPEKSYGSYQTTTPLADVPAMKRKHRKTTLKYQKPTHAPKTTTTVAADVPTEDSYGSYETTTLAEPITTTRRAYTQRTTTLADIPTTKAYGGYNQRKVKTTLADIPTTKAYHVRKTTTLADEPVMTTLGYSGDDYGESINLETTTLADIPTTKAYGYNVRKTTTLADILTTKAYGYNVRKTTTLADIPTTKAYGYNVRKTTTLADIPTTKAYGYNVRKTTTLVDIPTTKSYGYNVRRTTTLADIPTTKSYGYNVRKTTTLADIPTTKSYGYNVRKTTTLADIPTTKAYGYNVRKTTTLADIPTTKAYGGYNVRKTTTLADIPTTQAYGGYQTMLEDEPITTTRRPRVLKTTTTVAADVPEDDGYGSVETTTLADIPTTKSYNVRKTTTLADIPTTKAYGYNVRKTTTLADIPKTTLRQRSTYSKVKPTVADQPKTSY